MANSNESKNALLENKINALLLQNEDQPELSDIPEFPLVSNVEMPEGHPFDHGDIGILFHGLKVSGSDRIQVKSIDKQADDGTYSIKMVFPQIGLDGFYTVNSHLSPNITMDTGGNMIDHAESNLQPAGADSGEFTPITTEKAEAMMEQARLQKPKLRETENGQKMLAVFNQYNEIYNTLFITSQAARTTWYANNATQEMSIDTHEAMENNTVINSNTKTYGTNKVSYNSNAFTQQFSIIFNTLFLDPDINLTDPHPELNPDSQYVQAAIAAYSFGDAAEITGNDKVEVTELNSTSVYKNVAEQKPPTDATVAQLRNLLDQVTGTGGAEEKAEKNNWWVLDEEDRSKAKHFLYQAVQENLQKKALKPTMLWKGTCEVSITNVEVNISLSGNADGDVTILDHQILMPAFSLDIEDENWAGEIAVEARIRLNQIFFIKRLLHDKLEYLLKNRMGNAISHLDAMMLS